MNGNSINAKKVALNGILGALAVISLFFATFLPTNKISLFALSSFFIAVVIIENGLKAGWLFYAATTLLAFIIVPDKLGVLPYIFFFGIYGIVKLYIEKLNNIALEYVIKLVYFNICLFISYYFFLQIFRFNIKIQIPWWLIIIVLEIIFVVYDFVYTFFISYYRDKIKGKLKL